MTIHPRVRVPLPRALASLALAGLVGFLLAGCGGIPANAVVDVDGSPITKAAFDFLHGSPYTVSDLLLRIKLAVLGERLQKSVLAGAKGTHAQRRFAAFKRSFLARWKARTDCRPGYVVRQCRQYRAPRRGGGSG